MEKVEFFVFFWKSWAPSYQLLASSFSWSLQVPLLNVFRGVLLISSAYYTIAFRVSKPLSMGSFLMERIFRSTPNEVLTAHTEWLPGVRLRHSCISTTCAVHIEDCEGWWLSGCYGSVAEHWWLKPGASWVWLPATAGFFTFRLITSKFIYSIQNIWN